MKEFKVLRTIKMNFFTIFLICISSLSYGQSIQRTKMGASILEIDEKLFLAVSFENEKGWHTYWKNPGDAGLEIKLKFKLDNQEVTPIDLPWPAPKRYIEQGDMWAYGYSGKYALFYEIDQNYLGKNLEISGQWLVCKDICIPGEANLNLDIQNKESSNNSRLTSDMLVDIYHQLPEKSNESPVQFFLSKTGENSLTLYYMIENADFTKIKPHTNIITPYLLPLFDFKHEDVYLDHQNKIIYGEVKIDWDGVYEDPKIDLPLDGEFKTPYKPQFLLQYPRDQKAKIITSEFKSFSVNGEKNIETVLKSLNKIDPAQDGLIKSSIKKESKSLFYYILFAFLGGLILNLMPCVLPVISLKLFGLISHNEESNKNILKHNLSYTLGVVSSFLVLAVVVYLFKSSGETIGWGFQLQSPIFVFIMLMIIFIMALNMFGLFEFQTPGGKKLGNVRTKSGFTGDFVNGILATILSTPCSAPFLGAALGFAFTTSTLNLFIIFIAVGIGLSFPFILTGFFPSTISFLPKPGLWMDKLKKYLGLTLLVTVIWLYDVLNNLIDTSFSGIYINLIIVFVFFAFYFKKYISKNIYVILLVFLLPLIFFYQAVKINAFKVKEENSSISHSKLMWKPWTKSFINEKNEGPVFINFTASWCLTCKVNKKIVLESDDFQKLVKEESIELLEGDWTKRDEDISNFLASYSIVGVPAYFIKTRDGKIKSLGETISISKIKENLK